MVKSLELLQAVTMLVRGRLDEAKETAETEGELSREDVHDIWQGMQDLHEDGPRSQTTAERVAATHTPAGNARKGNASGGLRPSATPAQNQRQRKGRPSTAACI